MHNCINNMTSNVTESISINAQMQCCNHLMDVMPDFSTLYTLQTVNYVLLDANTEVNGIKAKRKTG
jgi:hypothetical protein